MVVALEVQLSMRIHFMFHQIRLGIAHSYLFIFCGDWFLVIRLFYKLFVIRYARWRRDRRLASMQRRLKLRQEGKCMRWPINWRLMSLQICGRNDPLAFDLLWVLIFIYVVARSDTSWMVENWCWILDRFWFLDAFML